MKKQNRFLGGLFRLGLFAILFVCLTKRDQLLADGPEVVEQATDAQGEQGTQKEEKQPDLTVEQILDLLRKQQGQVKTEPVKKPLQAKQSQYGSRIDVGWVPDSRQRGILTKQTFGQYGTSFYAHLRDNFGSFLGVDLQRFYQELLYPQSLDQFESNWTKLLTLDRLLAVSKHNPEARKAVNKFMKVTKAALARKQKEQDGEESSLSAQELEALEAQEEQERENKFKLFMEYYDAFKGAIDGARGCYEIFAGNGILRSVRHSDDPAIKGFTLFKTVDYADKPTDAAGVKGLNLERNYPFALKNIGESDCAVIGSLVEKDLKLYYNNSVSNDRKRPSGSHDSLLSRIRRTKTVFGNTVLDYQFAHPTYNFGVIKARQDLIEKLVQDKEFYDKLMQSFDKISRCQHECVTFIYNCQEEMLAELRPKKPLQGISRDFYADKSDVFNMLVLIQKLCLSTGIYPMSNAIEQILRSPYSITLGQNLIISDYIFMLARTCLHFKKLIPVALGKEPFHKVLLNDSTEKESIGCDMINSCSNLYETGKGKFPALWFPMWLILKALPRMLAFKDACNLYVYQREADVTGYKTIFKDLSVENKTLWKGFRSFWAFKQLGQDGINLSELGKDKWSKDLRERKKSEARKVVKTIQGFRTIAIEAEKIEKLLVEHKVASEALTLLSELKYFNSCTVTVKGKVCFNQAFKDLIDGLKALPEDLGQASALGQFRTIYSARYMFAPVLEALGEIDAISSGATLIRETQELKNKFNLVDFVQNIPESATVILPAVWYPYLDAAKAVSNDVFLPAVSQDPALAAQHMMISGINFGGKTTMLRTILVSALMAQVWGIVPAAQWTDPETGKINNPVMPLYQYIGSVINVEDDPSQENSRFTAQVRAMERERNIMAAISVQCLRSGAPFRPKLLVVDEIFNGTGDTDGVSLAIAYFEEFLKFSPNANLFVSTHFAPINWITQYPCSKGIANFVAPSDQEREKFKIISKPFESCVSHKYSGSSCGIAQAENQCKIPLEIIARAKEIRERVFTISNPNLCAVA